MSAKDIIHDSVKTALIKDGWTITDDPSVFSTQSCAIYYGEERCLSDSDRFKP
jgi:hypothetical protein